MSLLFDHQTAGAEWLAGRHRAMLGDVPGLGKTRTLIHALALREAKRPVVVCPAIVRSHWIREIEALGWPFRPTVISYDWLVRQGEFGIAGLLDDGADALVLDECHYLKSAKARRTKIILGKGGLAHRLPIVYAASGTPMPKHPAELWTILSSLFPRVVLERGLRTYDQWLDHFCLYRVTPHGPKVYGTKHLDELRAILAEVMLRRTLDDVGLDVPPILWSVSTVDVGQAAKLRRLEESAELAVLRDALAAGDDVGNLQLTDQIAHYRALVGQIKAPEIAAQLIDELSGSGEKLVVFAHHREVLAILRAALAPFGVCYVDGDVPHEARIRLIDRFQTDPAARVFVGQTIACQTGITLTAARRVVLVEPDWTGVVNQQAAHRVARIGQTADHCLAQMVALAGTLDEGIVRQHVRELRMVEEVLT